MGPTCKTAADAHTGLLADKDGEGRRLQGRAVLPRPHHHTQPVAGVCRQAVQRQLLQPEGCGTGRPQPAQAHNLAVEVVDVALLTGDGHCLAVHRSSCSVLLQGFIRACEGSLQGPRLGLNPLPCRHHGPDAYSHAQHHAERACRTRARAIVVKSMVLA